VKSVKNEDAVPLSFHCYLSFSGLLESTGFEQDTFCLACFNGKYPVKPSEDISKLCLEH